MMGDEVECNDKMAEMNTFVLELVSTQHEFGRQKAMSGTAEVGPSRVPFP